MSKQRQAGAVHAQRVHQNGAEIEELVLMARDLPSSQYKLGFLNYVVDQQILQMSLKTAKEGA